MATAASAVQQIAITALPAGDPAWVHYIQALGTPVVAVIAALIAGVIQFRQWKTAARKLKLDLFDKRMAIYTAAIDLIHDEYLDAEKTPYENILLFEQRLAITNTSRWLLDHGVHEYLGTLVDEAHPRMLKHFDGSVVRDVPEVTMQDNERRISQTRKLSDLLEPYLRVDRV